MSKILGLDLGTNSIGWAVIDTQLEGNQIVDKGVHIFSEGVKIEKGIESSKAAERTGYRSARRIKFRRKLRKIETLEVLIENKMCPLLMEELVEWKKNKKAYPKSDEFLKWLRTDEATNTNPYYFRDKASREKLALEDLGRAFYHLSQRRGFLSNRLDQGDDGKVEEIRLQLLGSAESEATNEELIPMLELTISNYEEEDDKAVKKFLKGVQKVIKENKTKEFEEFKKATLKFLNKTENLGAVKKGITELSQKIEEANCKTLGHYFLHCYKNNIKIRTHYTAREEHYLAEFEVICKVQGLGKINENEKLFNKRYEGFALTLYKAIFYQRPLKSQKGLIGKCLFEKSKSRCPVSHPAYERYRGLQYINSIKYKGEFLNPEQRELILPLFFRKSKPTFDFEEIAKKIDRTYIGPDHKKEFFNYKGFDKVTGCPTVSQLANIFGENWKDEIYNHYTLKSFKKKEGLKSKDEAINDVWHVLFTFDKDEKLKEFAKNNLGLDEKKAIKFSKIILKKDYASLSLKAINKILPYLHQGLIYSYAVFLANIEEVVGKEIWKEKENQEIIFRAISQIIDTHNETRKLESVVNGLMNNFKNEYNNSDKNYQLDEKDKKEVNEKIIGIYGKTSFQNLPKDKKEEIITWVENKYLEQLRKFRGEYIKAKRIDERIAEFLQDNFNVSEDTLKNLYHPSDMETFGEQEAADDGNTYLGSPDIPSIKNPMAMRTMHQLRHLVNTLIKEGKIDSETKVHIELARELNDANRRKAIQDWQKEKEVERAEAKEKIKVLYKEHTGKDIEPTDDDILKYILWEEQDHKCIYTGSTICVSDFAGPGPKFEIEHTIPRSLSYDNSQQNLTLCESRFNREVKRNRIPHELENHDDILMRLGKWRKNINDYEFKYSIRKKPRGIETKEQKDKRIREKHYNKLHLDYWETKYDRFTREDVPEGFKNSQIVDTGIITKYARSYMKSVFPNVHSIKGSLVKEFRVLWGIQEEFVKKERVNHIHHCIDAIMIACITKDKYDKLAKLYHADEENFQKDKKELLKISKPWATFVEDLKAIEKEVLVSHHTPDNMMKKSKKKIRVRGKILKDKNGNPKYQKGDSVRGSLHKETFYGAIKRKDESGENNIKYVFRKPLDSLGVGDIKNIVDDDVRKIVQDIVDKEGIGALKKDVWRNKEKGILIKKVRCVATDVTKPLFLKEHRDKSRFEHKRNYRVKNDGNYLMGIYEGKNKKGKIVRDFVIVNTLEAGERSKESNKDKSNNLIPLSKKTGKGINEIEIPLKATIKKGTMVLFYIETPEEIWDLSDEEMIKRLYKVQKFRDDSRITFRFHQEARPDSEINNLIKADNPIGSPQLLLSKDNYNFLVEGFDFIITPTGIIKLKE